MQFSGYMLDDTHAVSVLSDDDGKIFWTLFTFTKPVKDGIIDRDAEYTVSRIDPDNFYLNGEKIQLIAEKRL